MKKFVFSPRKILRKGYTENMSKAQYQGILWTDILKISGIYLVLFASIFLYLKFVNLSSTEGYFLRQANNELDVAKFNYEILKMKLLEYEKETWDNLSFSDKENTIEIFTTKKVVSND